MHEAHSAFIKENYEKSIKYYTKIINEEKFKEKHEESRLGRAKAYLNINKIEEAIADFKLLENTQFSEIIKNYLSGLGLPSCSVEKKSSLITDSSSKEIPTLTDEARSFEVVRDRWIQNSTEVILTLYKKNLDPEKVVVYFQPKHLVIDLELENKKIYRKSVSLSQTISTKDSSWLVTQYKAIITLVKIKPFLWNSLEVSDEQVKTNDIGKSFDRRKFDSLEEALEKDKKKKKKEIIIIPMPL